MISKLPHEKMLLNYFKSGSCNTHGNDNLQQEMCHFYANCIDESLTLFGPLTRDE